ncbi:MAG: YhbP family protein [Sodalis sp. (in: enterobacteria)]
MIDYQLAAICRFITKQHVLTLCAGNLDDIWCANCFYVFHQPAMALWLLTSPQTRHGKLIRENARVAGTIFLQSKTVALIKGVQYRGIMTCLLESETEREARRYYYHCFPIAKALISPLWQLDLLEVKMTDNTLGFGKKLRWQRQSS